MISIHNLSITEEYFESGSDESTDSDAYFEDQNTSLINSSPSSEEYTGSNSNLGMYLL